MRSKVVWRRPFLTLSQLIALVIIVAAIYILVDLARRGQAGQAAGVGEESLKTELAVETTRQVELQATLSYVQSEDYISNYAREEGGYLLPGEKRVVPLLIEGTPAPTPVPQPTPDPAESAQPWQAWWQLLTDAPLPAR